MAKAKRRGDLDGMGAITMKAARTLHRRLRFERAIRRSFKRWFRAEAEGMPRSKFRGKARVIAGV